MNQPYDPYGHQQQPGHSTPPGYGQQQGPYGPGGPTGGPPKKSGKLPIIVAAAVVVALAVGVALFFVLRDDEKTADGSGGGGSQTTEPQKVSAEDAEAVAQTFIAAVDDKDSQTLQDVTRGKLAGQIEEIVSVTDGLNLGSGDYYQDTETTEVEDGHLAIVYWQVDLDGDTGILAGMMYAEEGSDEGYQVCNVDDKYLKDVDQMITMEEWQEDYQSDCEITSSGGSSGGSDEKSGATPSLDND